MNYRRETKNLFVSSESRDKNLFPYGNSYTLHITTPIKDIERVELISASVPNSIYNITDGSNIIALSNITTSNITNSNLLTYISIPPGFYTASGLATEIQNAEFLTCNITITHLQNEGKFLFTRSSTTGNAFSVYVQTKEIADIFGFTDYGVVYQSGEPSSSSTSNNLPLYYQNLKYNNVHFIKTNKIYNLNPNEGIFLDIEELRSNFNETALAMDQGKTYYTGQNIARSFGQIPMDVNRGEVKKFKKYSDFDFIIDYPHIINKLDRVTVRWTDRFNNLINFNGVDDNSFILRFHTVCRN